MSQSPFENLVYPEDPTAEALLNWGRDLIAQMRLINIEADVPVGTLMPFAGSVIPGGWLACEGQVLSSETFPALWRRLGTRWNEEGDAAGTFRLPNAVGRTFMHSDELYGGTSELAITQANLPTIDLTVTDPGHTHTFAGANHTHTVNENSHTHALSGSPAMAGGNVGVASGDTMVGTTIGGALTAAQTKTNVSLNQAQAGGTNATAETGITVSLGGEEEPLELVPAFFGGKWIIKVG